MRWLPDEPQLALFGPEQRELPSVEYMAVNARRIINTLPASSRMPFRHTINVYRGCRHACTYCFARPTHEYLGLNSGEDFERRIVVKVNAVEKLDRELEDPAWRGDSIAMGTNTDPYQPAEGHYRLTRGLVEVLSRRRNPFSILTKSSLIVRDIDLLSEAAGRTRVNVAMSIGTDEDAVARITEPGAASPSSRLQAISKLPQDLPRHIVRKLGAEVDADAFGSNQPHHLLDALHQCGRRVVEQQMRFVEHERQLRLLEIAHLGQLFEQLGQHPQQERRVESRLQDEAIRGEDAHDAAAGQVGTHQISELQRRLAEKLLAPLAIEPQQCALNRGD